MDTIWCVVYCQGFCISNNRFAIREMGLCDLSGHHSAVYAYNLCSSMPSYAKLTPEDKTIVDKASAVHGVSYEAKYCARSSGHETDDLDAFEANYGTQIGKDSTYGVWSGDAVAQAFLTGLGVKFTLIEHNQLSYQPLGCILSDEEQHRNPDCAGHGLQKMSEEEWDTDQFDHRCSLEFACALAAYVRAQTHYRSPTILEDLNQQRLLWQRRVDLILEYVLCDDCAVAKSEAFEHGEGVTWCDTTNCDGGCKTVGRILSYGVHQPWSTFYDYTNYRDDTLDTLCVYTPIEGTN